MKVSKFMAGGFLKPEMLKHTGPRVVTIVDVTEVGFEARNGRPSETKAALICDDAGSEVRVALNSTNLRFLVETFKSDDSDTWAGHDIELFYDPQVMFGGKVTGGLRMRVPSHDFGETPTPASAR